MTAANLSSRNWKIAITAVVLLGLALHALAFTIWDANQADELMQYLEQANRWVTGSGAIPWEAREGIRNWLVPLTLMPGLAIGHAIAPGTLTGVVLARITYGLLCMLTLPAAWMLGNVRSPRHALIAMLVAATWCMSVLMSSQLLSESLAAPILVMAAAILLRADFSLRANILAGVLLGLGMLLRLQYGAFILVLVAMALGRDWQRWGHVIIGGLIAIVFEIGVDLAMGTVPFAWAWNYIYKVLVIGHVVQPQEQPAYEYLLMIPATLGPMAVFILFGACASGRRFWPVLVAALVNVAAHSVIPLKVFRFVWLSQFLFLLLAAIASVELLDMLARRKANGDPAAKASNSSMVLLACIWLAASALDYEAVGGAAKFRFGGEVAGEVDAASRDPKTCGILLPFQIMNQTVPALVSGPTPLYIAVPDVADGRLPLSAGEIAAANTMVTTTGLPKGAEGYSQVSCTTRYQDKACTYRRAGPCDPAANRDATYQRFLEVHGL